MTVIAWDGKTLAADKRTSFGGLHATTTKIHRLRDGSLVGGSGGTAVIQEMVAWLDAGADPATFPAAQRTEKESVAMLVVRPDRSLVQYDTTPYPSYIENDKWAIGSGRDYAMAVMFMGHDSELAVRVASALDSTCGNGVDTATFPELLAEPLRVAA